MTIRWAGGEDHNFEALRAAAVVDLAGQHDAARARCSLRAQGIGGPDYAFNISGSPLTEVWLHYDLYTTVQPSDDGSTDGNTVELWSQATGRLCALGATNALTRLTRDNNGGGTTDLYSGGPRLIRNILHQVDIHLNLNVSPSTMEYFLDGSSVSGVIEGEFNDIASAGVDRVVIRSSYTGGSARYHYVSQVMVDDSEDLRDWSLQTRIPNRDGEYGSWAGSLSPSFDTLTEVVMDNTFLTSAIADEVSSFAFQDLPGDIGDLVPRAVVNTVGVRRGEAGPQNLQLGLRITDDSPGSDYFSSDLTLATAIGPAYNIDSINPHTGSPWTVAEVDALESIIKSRT